MNNPLRTIVAGLIPKRWRQHRRLRSELTGTDLVLVHTMAKVGSASVYHSLKTSCRYPLYHNHFLSGSGIESARTYFRNAGAKVPYNIEFADLLRRHLDRPTQIFIITLVRDPIAREISSYFQLADRMSPAISDPATDPNVVLADVKQQVLLLKKPDHFAHRWFDDELRSPLGIDVFATPFDFDSRYVIMKAQRVNLLVIRLEDLDDTYEEAMATFLPDGDTFSLSRHNVRRAGEYGRLWSYVTQNLKLDDEDCRQIYGSKLATHFYQDMIDILVSKWTGR